jgi:nucleoside 2-deoxyribosyltransferase
MNVYFSCSITGGRQDQAVYAAIVDHLLAAGHIVPTAALAHPSVMSEEQVIHPVTVYERDVAWVQGCDALIAEVSTPSHGVGYEIALALMLGKPVLCCYQHGKLVSKMLTGNTLPNIQVSAYTHVEEVLTLVTNFLSKCQTG